MPTIDFRDIEAIRAQISQTFSDWSQAITVTQQMIDEFARLSGDDYWIHTDPARAAKDSPFGTTIAHGMLVQSLASRMHVPLPVELTGFNNMVNYGSDRLRFAAPVPAEARIHSRSRLRKARAVPAGTLLTVELNIHVVGNDRPSVINEILVLYM